MNISTVIEELQAIQEKHGDIEVTRYDHTEYYHHRSLIGIKVESKLTFDKDHYLQPSVCVSIK